MALDIVGGPPLTTGILALSLVAAHVPLPGSAGALLLQGGSGALANVTFDASGAATFPVTLPPTPFLAGLAFYTQTAALGTTSILLSNGVEIVICP